MGGRYLEHDCGLSRSIGYFLEPLIVLGLFGKNPLSIKLKGLELKIESREVVPNGGGQVTLSVPIIHNSLKFTWLWKIISC
ncbi:probable RNA 3'-terminal phosphate cyclase-like protein isoform X2 [Rutidosis leptorrhynchoides]